MTDKFASGLKVGPTFDRLCDLPQTAKLQELVEAALIKEALLKELLQIEDVNKLHKVKAGITRPQDKNLNKEKGRDGEKACYYCNKGGHDFKRCKFKNYTCNKCKKKGHIAAACSNNRIEFGQIPLLE